MTEEAAPADGPKRGLARLGFNLGLSGKLLVLTILFVLIAEVLIYVPSIATFRVNWLSDRLAAAHTTLIPPLMLRARDTKGRMYEHYSINEVSLFRQTYQVARLSIAVDGKERLPELMADGVLVATPAGSTANLNLSRYM